MLSALIRSGHSHPACRWRDSRNTMGPSLRRCELSAAISLLSPEYLLSVERRRFHKPPPDHYVPLSRLLDVSVSQSGPLLPLRSTHGCRPC